MVEGHKCGSHDCVEESRKIDATGDDLYPAIELDRLECFNERVRGSVRNIVKPFEDKKKPN